MKLTYIIDRDCLVKEYLKESNLSSRILKRMHSMDNIYINGEKARNYYPLHKGDKLELVFVEEMNDDIVAMESSNNELDIVYEDDYLMVVNKPSYISSMPSIKHQTDNILSYVKWYLVNKNEKCNMHLVNRLDYQTSGLLLIAKSGIMHYELSKEDIEKRYLCVVEGIMNELEGVIELPISRYPAPEIKRFIDLQNGKPAKTIYKVLESSDNKSLIDVKLVTGRTHQIRLHFSYLGYPLLGDKLYNDSVNENSKVELYLHSYYLRFIHPITSEIKEFKVYPKWIEEWRKVCQE